jgi:hypothetical protein
MISFEPEGVNKAATQSGIWSVQMLKTTDAADMLRNPDAGQGSPGRSD